MAGVLVGAIVDVAWLLFLSSSTGIYELLPGFIASMIAAVIVTLLDKAPAADVVAIYDTAMDPTIDD